MSDARREAARSWWASLCGIKPSTFQAFNAGWDAAVKHLEQPSLFDEPEPRVIPSRTTDPVTSHKAAAAVTVKAGSQRSYLLLPFYWQNLDHDGTPLGLTDEEAMNRAAQAGLPVSARSEYSKRCSELREAGLIEPTGETRTGASGHQRIVSKITELGRAVVRELQ